MIQAKQKYGLTSFLMLNVLKAKIFQYDFQEEHNVCLILVANDEMLVTLATVLVTISSPGMAFKILCLCQACSLVKGKGQIGPFFIFLGAISDCNAGFPQGHALVETLKVNGN